MSWDYGEPGRSPNPCEPPPAKGRGNDEPTYYCAECDEFFVESECGMAEGGLVHETSDMNAPGYHGVNPDPDYRPAQSEAEEAMNEEETLV